MLSPNQAWKTEGIPNWILAVPELVDLEDNKPVPCMLPRSFRLGFKAGVKVANRDFCEKLNADHRQN